MGEEFYLAGGLEEGFLYQVLLRFAFVRRLLFIGLLQLFHQVTVPVAMQPWPAAVLTQFGGNVAPVHVEACVNKKARKTTADNAKDKQYGCDPVLHACKGITVFIIYNIHTN